MFENDSLGEKWKRKKWFLPLELQKFLEYDGRLDLFLCSRFDRGKQIILDQTDGEPPENCYKHLSKPNTKLIFEIFSGRLIVVAWNYSLNTLLD